MTENLSVSVMVGCASIVQIVSQKLTWFIITVYAWI